MEMVNFDKDVKAQILKRLSINLCCNVSVRLHAMHLSLSTDMLSSGTSHGRHDVSTSKAK
jgi:hypothetical protein